VDTKQKDVYFYCCAKYVTVMCWRKMQHRVHHWVSIGIIYLLAKIKPETLQRGVGHLYREGAADKPMKTQRTDVELYKLLKGLGADVIKEILDNFHPLPGVTACNGINNLMAALKLIAKSDDWSLSAYNANTCTEFHHFLVSLLLGYGRVLSWHQDAEVSALKKRQERIKAEAAEKRERRGATGVAGQGKGRKKDKDKDKDKEEVLVKGSADEVDEDEGIGDLMGSIWDYTHLLWITVSSWLFKDHLAVLKFGNHILWPEPDKLAVYSEWMGFGGGVVEDGVGVGGEGMTGEGAEAECVNKIGDYSGGNGHSTGDNDGDGTGDNDGNGNGTGGDDGTCNPELNHQEKHFCSGAAWEK
jgi:hypothetical protein